MSGFVRYFTEKATPTETNGGRAASERNVAETNFTAEVV